MNEEELKEERDLRATLDMWENMEEEQRLKQLKFLINEGFQKGKLEERERIIEVVKGFLGRNDYQRFIKALDKKISKISRKRRIGLE